MAQVKGGSAAMQCGWLDLRMLVDGPVAHYTIQKRAMMSTSLAPWGMVMVGF